MVLFVFWIILFRDIHKLYNIPYGMGQMLFAIYISVNSFKILAMNWVADKSRPFDSARKTPIEGFLSLLSGVASLASIS